MRIRSSSGVDSLSNLIYIRFASMRCAGGGQDRVRAASAAHREDGIMPRRRSREEAGEPLFGEDWWREDQQLFQDSVARTAAAGRRPRSRRATRRAARPGTLPDGYAQDALFSADDIAAIEGAEHEPVRPEGPEALGALAARPVLADRGSGQLLLGLGEVSGGEDRQPGAGPGGRRPARGGGPG